jgi:hypothetical protein
MHFSRLGCPATLGTGAICLQVLRTMGDRTARDAAAPDRTLVGWSEPTLFQADAIRQPNPPLWSDHLP